MSLLNEIKETYTNSLKERDIAWNTYVARPLAALLLLLLIRSKCTPNQVTILGAFIFTLIVVPLIILPIGFFLAFFGIVLIPSPGFEAVDLYTSLTIQLTIAVFLIEIAYIFDCADGQLARIKGMTSPVGAYFDFFIDELKAAFLVVIFSIHIFLWTQKAFWLFVGLFGVFIVTTATSMTNFIRRPEYTGKEEIKPGASANVADIPKGALPKVVWLIKRILSFIIHYPSWIWIMPIVDAMLVWLRPEQPYLYQIGDLVIFLSGSSIFLIIFLSVYLIYLIKTSFGIIRKLGSPSYYNK